jgi:hypothetical protein
MGVEGARKIDDLLLQLPSPEAAQVLTLRPQNPRTFVCFSSLLQSPRKGQRSQTMDPENPE